MNINTKLILRLWFACILLYCIWCLYAYVCLGISDRYNLSLDNLPQGRILVKKGMLVIAFYLFTNIICLLVLFFSRHLWKFSIILASVLLGVSVLLAAWLCSSYEQISSYVTLDNPLKKNDWECFNDYYLTSSLYICGVTTFMICASLLTSYLTRKKSLE